MSGAIGLRCQLQTLESRKLLSASLAVGEVLYTASPDANNAGAVDLYRSNLDGSNAQLLRQWQHGGNGPDSFIAYKNKLVFTASEDDNDQEQRELWITDGTSAGTKMIASTPGTYGITPQQLHVINGNLVFEARQFGYNFKLYGSDGTAAGTHILVGANDVRSGIHDVHFTDNAVTLTELATDAHNFWTSDGTVAGTQKLGSQPAGPGYVLIKPATVSTIDVHFVRYETVSVVSDGVAKEYELPSGMGLKLDLGDNDATVTVDPFVSTSITFVVGGGNQQIFAYGGGQDTLDFSNGTSETINVAEFSPDANGVNGYHTSAVDANGHTLFAVGVFQTIIGTAGNDSITGNSLAEVLIGGDGEDTIAGNGGEDLLIGGDAHDLAADTSTDTLIGLSVDDFFAGGIGDHLISSGQGLDTVVQPVGTDDSSDGSDDSQTSDDGGSDNSSTGGESSDPVVIAPAPSFYSLKNGVLRINGPGQANIIKLIGSAGSIKLSVNGQTGKVSLANVHSIIVRGGAFGDNILLQNLAIPSKIYGFGGNDAITTSDGKDRIYGGDGNDIINGGANHDTIYGEAGNDRIYGDAGHDYLVGGAGTDTLRGGIGVDHLIFSRSDDYRSNAGDKLTIDELLG